MPDTGASPFVPQLFAPPGLTNRARQLYYRWGLMTTAQVVGPQEAFRLARLAGLFLWKHIPLVRDGMPPLIAPAFAATHDERQVAAMARAYAKSMWLNFVETEYVHRKLRAGTWRKHVRCVGLDRLIETVRGGRGVVGAGAYFGNHQVGMTVLGLILGGRVAGIVSPVQFSTQQRWMAHVVRRRLATLYPRGEAVGGSLRALRDGRLLLVIGEHERSGAAAVATEYLGRRQAFHPTVAMLAWRTRCPLAVLTCRRLDEPFQFELRVRDWIEPPASGRRGWIHDTTIRVVRGLEVAIREHPEQYAWSRRYLLAGRDTKCEDEGMQPGRRRTT